MPADRDEVLFENRYTEDKSIVREFHKYCLCKNQRRVGLVALIATLVLLGVLLAGMIGAVNFSEARSVHLGEASTILLVLGVLMTLYPRITAAIALSQDKKNMNWKIPETIVQFSENDVVISELGKVKTFHYRELGEFRETKNLLVMMISKYAGIVLKKDGFSYGTEAAFREFISRKYSEGNPT